MWQHNYEPVGGSHALSALVAAIPIAVLFLMLGVWRLSWQGRQVGFLFASMTSTESRNRRASTVSW